jgi:hypothetical protein
VPALHPSTRRLQVSNSELTEGEYDKARVRGARGGKVITKGDVAAAAERLQHART